MAEDEAGILVDVGGVGAWAAGSGLVVVGGSCPCRGARGRKEAGETVRLGRAGSRCVFVVSLVLGLGGGMRGSRMVRSCSLVVGSRMEVGSTLSKDPDGCRAAMDQASWHIIFILNSWWL